MKNHLWRIITILAGHICAISAARKSIIIDTDLFSDVDDAAALLLAATSPSVDLLAVNINYPSSYSALCASAILAHYGHPDVPIGVRRPLTNQTFFDGWYFRLGEYASKVAYHWSGGSLPWGRAEDAWEPVSLYRKVLHEAGGEVTIASIGFLENLSALLNSSADEYSPLSGPELVASKVSELAIMGGDYPSGREYNFWGSNASLSAHVVNHWPGRMVFLGSTVGKQVHTGMPLMLEGPENDPVKAAYIYYTYRQPRASWDPLTLLYAMDGLGDLFKYGNEDGFNFVEADGSNRWVQAEEKKDHFWLELSKDNETVADFLDKRLLEGAWSVEHQKRSHKLDGLLRTEHAEL